MDHLKMARDDVQLNLFHPQPTLPHWAQLPTEAQEITCELLAQMLNEYLAARARTSPEKELINE
jgi:hypothetical protein